MTNTDIERHDNGADRLDVVLLLDDPDEFGADVNGHETFLAIREVVDALEPALERLGHRSRRLSFAMGVPAVVAKLHHERPDVVFQLGQPLNTDPANEAQVTALLDLMGLPHTSESPETLMLARDKARAKALFAHHKIPTASYALSVNGSLPHTLPAAPWIAKPSLEDGSIGIGGDKPAGDRGELGQRVRALHERFAEPILIETFIGGREFQVGVVGRDLLPILEIDYSAFPDGTPHLDSYDAKWKYETVECKAVRYACPASTTDTLAATLRDVAGRTRDAFGIQRSCRIDIRIDEDENVYVLDVNPNPDLSPIATMPLMADAAGWGFDGLVRRLIDLARSRRVKGR